MAAVDRLNARFGQGTVIPAAVGLEWAWAQRRAQRSPCQITRLGWLPVVQA